MSILVSEVGPRDGPRPVGRTVPTAAETRRIGALAAAARRGTGVGISTAFGRGILPDGRAARLPALPIRMGDARPGVRAALPAPGRRARAVPDPPRAAPGRGGRP